MQPVTGDKGGIVEVIPGIEPHSGGELGAKRLFMGLVKQADLDAIDLGGMATDQLKHHLIGVSDIAGTQIARQRRVEHLTQPMQDDGLGGIGEQGIVDIGIVGGARAHCR